MVAALTSSGYARTPGADVAVFDGATVADPSARAELLPAISTPPGTTHAADAAAEPAQIDLTATNLPAGRPATADLTGQNVGGLTLAPDVRDLNSSIQLTPLALVSPFLFINWFLCLLAIHHGFKQLRRKQYQDALELKVRLTREALVENYGAEIADAILTYGVRLGIPTETFPRHASGSYQTLEPGTFSSDEPTGRAAYGEALREAAPESRASVFFSSQRGKIVDQRA